MKPARWIVLLLVGCMLGAPREARAYDKRDFVAPKDKARIVFVQNQRSDRKMAFTVFESDKSCVAEVGGREAQTLDVFPGPYVLYVRGYNTTRRIELYSTAGRTYFVRLHTVDGVLGPAPDITLVRRKSDEHKRLRFTLDGAIVTHAEDNRKCYARPLKERENRTQRRLNEANAEWKNSDDIHRDKYRLMEKDGLTPKDISLL